MTSLSNYRIAVGRRLRHRTLNLTVMLAAHAVGLGSCWIHRAKEEFEMEEFKDLLKDLGLEGDYEGIGHLAIGYIDGEVPAARLRHDNRYFCI